MIKNYIATFIFSVVYVTTFSQIPVISFFSPVTGPVGSQVTISGNNFSPAPDGNIVYFGTVRAIVNNGTANSITATVPHGSLYMPISVKVDTLIAFSKQAFITSFGNGAASLRTNSFGGPVTIAEARIPCYADFDNDGLADMAAIITNNRISIFKNIGTPGNAAFGAATIYSAVTYPMQIIACELNGDGKLDLAVVGMGSSVIALYRNISSNDTIRFDLPLYYPLNDNAYSIDANDVDGDGKTDLVVGYSHAGTCFSVARNTSTGGNISFALRVNYAFGTVPGGAGNVGDANKIIVADIDGDAKPDVLSRSRFFDPFLIYRNTSVPGSISFAAKTVIQSNRILTIANGYFDFKVADFDGDSKKDIVYVASDSAHLSFYRNTSVPGTISYGVKVDAEGGYHATNMAVNDMNGDGKPDVAAVYADTAMILKNNSTAGNIVMALRKMFWTGQYPSQDITLADINTDGKADIIVSGTDVNNNDRNKTIILANIIGDTASVSLCNSADSTILETGSYGSLYQWQLNTGNGFENITDDANHIGVNSSELVVRNLASSMYGYQYRCVVDNINGSIQVLKFTVKWTGNFSNVWENPGNWQCGQLPDANTDVILGSNAFVTLNSNVSIRSLQVAPGGYLRLSAGFNLTVSH
ncbi:MAG: FG-GAP-like repeat-containing protein [Bacteroidota bacterium]